MDVETQLRAEIKAYNPNTDIKNIPRAVARVDEILAYLDHPDVEIRRYVASGAIYAIMGNLPPDKREALLTKAAAALTPIVNGHTEPAEPDVYVRERCVEVFRLAASCGCDISAYTFFLTLARDSDPHEWVRDKARETLQYSTSSGERVDPHRLARVMDRNARTSIGQPTGPRKPELRI